MSSGTAGSVPFDYCVVTASTPAQASLYQALIQRRKECGLYPAGLEFRVYPDPPKGRVGSGGGTLVALCNLFQNEVGKSALTPEGADETALREFFGQKRVLVLHAGGESRRLPCYVPEGKLFGPLSMTSEAECPPVVLDLVLALYFKYPWVPGEVILASGDVIVDFDTASLSDKDTFKRGAICGFGKAAPLEQGSRHGVFAFQGDADANSVTMPVRQFLQKASVATLQAECLLPGTTDKCALDTGIFTLGVEWCLALFRFAAQVCDEEGFTVMRSVEESRLYFDFYDEVVRASLPGQAKEAYLKEMSKSKLPVRTLEALHECMTGLELRGASMPEVGFLHFGTLREFPEASMMAAEASLLPFYLAADAARAPQDSSAKQSQADAGVVLVNCTSENVQVARASVEGSATAGGATPAWVEMCSDVSLALSSGDFHLVVGLQGVHLQEPLPAGICLDSRTIPSLVPDGQIVAVYSADDSFKAAKAPGDVVFCGMPLPTWLSARGLSAADIWGEADAAKAVDLWTAKLFRKYSSPEDLEGYWNDAKFVKNSFLESARFSLQDLNLNDSAADRDRRRAQLRSSGEIVN